MFSSKQDKEEKGGGRGMKTPKKFEPFTCKEITGLGWGGLVKTQILISTGQHSQLMMDIDKWKASGPSPNTHAHAFMHIRVYSYA